MTLFIDTSVIMHAAGTDHPLRASCQAIVERAIDRSIDAVISAEVIQEILHQAVAMRRTDEGIALANQALDLFAPVIPITHALIRRVPDLIVRYPALDARDAVHVATCIHEGITEIISADRGYDDVAEVRRIDPLAFAG